MKMPSPQVAGVTGLPLLNGLAIRCITTLPTLLLRRGQDSNLQPQWGDGFQDRLTAIVHPSKQIIYFIFYFSCLALIKLTTKQAIEYNVTNCIIPTLKIPLKSPASILLFNGMNNAMKTTNIKTKII